MEKYINIGKFVSAFGLGGELIVRHALGKKTTFKEIEAIFLEQVKNVYLPYFVAYSKPKNAEETYLRLEGVDNREKALKLVQKNLWLLQGDFRRIVATDSPVALLGYILINDGKRLGEIDEVIEQPHQVLLQIKMNDKDVFIPLHDETLTGIDHKRREVHVTLPAGLLEVYL